MKNSNRAFLGKQCEIKKDSSFGGGGMRMVLIECPNCGTDNAEKLEEWEGKMVATCRGIQDKESFTTTKGCGESYVYAWDVNPTVSVYRIDLKATIDYGAM